MSLWEHTVCKSIGTLAELQTALQGDNVLSMESQPSSEGNTSSGCLSLAHGSEGNISSGCLSLTCRSASCWLCFAGWQHWNPVLPGKTSRSFQSFSSGVSSKAKTLPEVLVCVINSLELWLSSNASTVKPEPLDLQ